MDAIDYEALIQGNKYVVTSPITLTPPAVSIATTLHLNTLFKNPANSGSLCTITKILFFLPATSSMIPSAVTFFKNPNDLPNVTLSSPINMLTNSQNQSLVSLWSSFSATAMSGGVSTPYELSLTNGTNLTSEPFAIAPGDSFGLDFSKAVAINAVPGVPYVMIYYISKPI